MVDFNKLVKLHTSVRAHLKRFYMDEIEELSSLDSEVVAAYLVGMNRSHLPFSAFPSTLAAIAAVTVEVRYVRNRGKGHSNGKT